MKFVQALALLDSEKRADIDECRKLMLALSGFRRGHYVDLLHHLLAMWCIGLQESVQCFPGFTNGVVVVAHPGSGLLGEFHDVLNGLVVDSQLISVSANDFVGRGRPVAGSSHAGSAGWLGDGLGRKRECTYDSKR